MDSADPARPDGPPEGAGAGQQPPPHPGGTGPADGAAGWTGDGSGGRDLSPPGPGGADQPWLRDGAGPPSRRRRGRWAGYVASAVAGLAKIKVALVAVSALVSLLAYGLAFGWRFGALFLLILALHETGHSVAIRQRGLPASLPVFIPFLGALINLRRQPRDAGEEAFIAAAGPAFGLGASWALLWLGAQLRAPVLTVAASFGMLIHVFNLLPVTPLDGGRTVAFLRWKAWIPGFIALLVLLFYDPHTHRLALTDPFAPIILAFIVANIAAEARRRPPAAYDAIPRRAKAFYTAVWLGLLLLAGGGYVMAPRMLFA